MKLPFTNTCIHSQPLIKTLAIGRLILLLLIPIVAIQDLIEESESVGETNDRWSGRQHLSGPAVTIPATPLFCKERVRQKTE